MGEGGKTIILTEFCGDKYLIPDYVTDDWKSANTEKIQSAVVVDVETSGISHQLDQIIEIGMILFKFNREDGALIEVTDSYTSLNELKKNSEPLSKFVSQLTRLTEKDLAGHVIDWNKVNALLKEADIVIAHNARFDRPFIDSLSLVSRSKVWGCSFSQIDWMAKGFRTQGLELLCQRHGFFVGAHRALADAQGALHLISHVDKVTGKTYLAELLENAKTPQVSIESTKAPFEKKEILKSRQYRWNPQKRVWTKVISENELESEKDWLMKNVYVNFDENPASAYKVGAAERFQTE